MINWWIWVGNIWCLIVKVLVKKRDGGDTIEVSHQCHMIVSLCGFEVSAHCVTVVSMIMPCTCDVNTLTACVLCLALAVQFQSCDFTLNTFIGMNGHSPLRMNYFKC